MATTGSGLSQARICGHVPRTLMKRMRGTCVEEDGSGMILGHTGEGHGPGDPYGDVNHFISRHGKGCFFGFCDGHVRYLRKEMNYQVYKALSTRNWGEIISDGY